MWLLLYCLCPEPVVLTHSYHGVPLRGTSCSRWCTEWWAGRIVGRAPPCTARSGTAATHHSPRSIEYTCHSSCLAGRLEQRTRQLTIRVHVSHHPTTKLNTTPHFLTGLPTSGDFPIKLLYALLLSPFKLHVWSVVTSLTSLSQQY
jgi:hypothetical protein